MRNLGIKSCGLLIVSLLFSLAARVGCCATLTSTKQVSASIKDGYHTSQYYTDAEVRISGYVRNLNGTGLGGVTMHADSPPNYSAITGTLSTGYYLLTLPSNRSWTVTASKSGYDFDPVNMSYTNLTSDQTNQNYIYYARPEITGEIRIEGGGFASGVVVSANNGGGSDTTDVSGQYRFHVPYNWSGTVTPSKAEWLFSPSSREYIAITETQWSDDYVAFQPNISGYIKDYSGNGISGVSISADNGGGSSVTNTVGYYSIEVSANWSGTITPSKAGWRFNPINRVYTVVNSNIGNQDYTAFQVKISGFIKDESDSPISGATVSADNGGNSVVTDVNGYYGITVPFEWSGTVTPNKINWSFEPASLSYSNVMSDWTGQNYTAIQQIITGYVLELDGITPLQGVFIDANSCGGNPDVSDAVTNMNGYYEIKVPYSWCGTITPQKEFYAFEPNAIFYDSVIANEVNDYTVELITFKISGYVLEEDYVTGINDVNVCAENSGGAWTSKYGGGCDTTETNGYYEVTVDYGWSGTVTPTKHAYSFDECNIIYTNVLADQNNQNYTGGPLVFAISGYIRNECNNIPIKDVLVCTGSCGDCNTTDPNGYYEVWVPANWSGTVTPGKAYYTFDPNSIVYSDVLEDKIEQNYSADNVYDLDCDDIIDWGDIAVMANNWLSASAICDFNTDTIVNFKDYAEFANVWLTEYNE